MNNEMWLATIEDDNWSNYEQRIFCSKAKAIEWLESYYGEYVHDIPLTDYGCEIDYSENEWYERYFTKFGDVTLYASQEDYRGLFDRHIYERSKNN